MLDLLLIGFVPNIGGHYRSGCCITAKSYLIVDSHSVLVSIILCNWWKFMNLEPGYIHNRAADRFLVNPLTLDLVGHENWMKHRPSSILAMV
jgi:hypothetical protein